MLILFYKFLKSLYSVFLINFFTKKGKKNLLFYNPSEKFTGVTMSYMDKFLSNYKLKFNIIYGHQNLNFSRKEKYYYVNHYFLKFLLNINYFITSYISDKFPLGSKKIYIHHDIYDTPIVSKNKMKELRNRLDNYNYIFTPSKISREFFENLIDIKKNNKTTIHELGYVKLDYLRRRRKTIFKRKQIIIAPTHIYSIKEFSMKDSLETIIENFLNKTSYKIVLRPHPANRKDRLFINIFNKFKKFENFKYDISDDYYDNYMSSMILLTDISGTAYTYSFLTNNPVIFYIRNKKIINEYKFNKLRYFKDIRLIGKKIFNKNDIINTVNELLKNKLKYKVKIKKLKQRRIKYLDQTENRFLEIINKLENK